MDTDDLVSRVQEALRDLDVPDGAAAGDGSERVRGVRASEGGEVRLELRLAPGDPPEVADAYRTAAAAVEGVRAVRMDVRPAGEREEAAPRRGSGRSLPIMGQGGGSGGGSAPGAAGPAASRSGRPRGSAPGGGGSRSSGGPRPVAADREASSRHPSEAPPLPGVSHVIAVSSGKGGVGKSTVATNLAVALSEEDRRVGLLDADVYGPDIPTMFGTREKPRMDRNEVIPLEAHGVKLMSIGFLVEEEMPAIWRGPIIQGIVRQFLQQVRWGELDFLIVDLPPGTGDAQLSLAQLVRLDGGVFVTTPQDVALGGVLKGIKMFERLEIPVLGVVENMSGFVCPDCGSRHEIFGAGGGEKIAASLEAPFLGTVPLGTAVREEGDRGVPTVLGRPDAPESRALRGIAEAVRERVARLAAEGHEERGEDATSGAPGGEAGDDATEEGEPARRPGATER